MKSCVPPSIDTIDALLPQTQCRLCGYAGCRPYAEAIAAGQAQINQCPPGGDEVIAELALVLSVPALPLDTAHGETKPPAVALIDETRCIGCALCIVACPVDAIIGTRRRMHTVITADCTGCELCLPPCPVDCITLVATGAPHNRAAQKLMAARTRELHTARTRRLDSRNRARRNPAAATVNADAGRRKRETIARALARAQARLAGKSRV